MTSGPVTSGPATSGPATSGPATSGPATSGRVRARGCDAPAMTDARQDVLTAFLSFATEYGDGPFAEAVAGADPRLEDVANGTVVVLSPADVPTRKLLLEPAHRRNLDDAVELAQAAGWRVDPPRAG